MDALNYGKSGRQFLGEAFDRTPVQNFPFYIDGHNPSDSITIRSVVASRSIITTSNFSVSANNNFIFSHSNIPTISNTYDGYYYRTSGPVVASFYASTPSVNITYRYDNPPGGAIGWLDFFEINTRSKLTWFGNQVLYRTNTPEQIGATQYKITGAPSSARIFNLSDLANIQELIVK